MKINQYEFAQIQKLYHYTTLERAISILSTKKLFMGRLGNMNDINESYRPLSAYIGCGKGSINDNLLKVAEQQLNCIRQSSLSIDGEMPGFGISAMWGHYADKGMGICIVLSKRTLEEKLKQNTDFYYQKVSYEKNYEPNITISEDPEKYFRQNIKTIFFKKEDCWKYEQEYRIICRAENSPAYVDISECVIALIMCYAKGANCQESCFTSETYIKLSLLFPDYPILEWSTGVCGSCLRDNNGKQWYPITKEKITLDV